MLGYLGVNVEVLNISIETMDFSKCRKISRVNRIANSMLATCYILI